MKLPLSLLCLLVLPVALPGQSPQQVAPLEAYVALGASLVQDNRLAQLGWTDAQVEAFVRGVRAGFRGEGPPVDGVAQGLLNEIGRRTQELEREENRRRFGPEAFARPGYLAAYLKQIQARFELQAGDSGLLFGIRNPGSGARPEPGDTVILSYKVTAADMQTDLPGIGGERIKVKVSDLLPGLAEAVQMMGAASAAMLVLPPDLSYGEGEWPAGSDRGTPLIFTVMLHDIIPAP